MEYLKNEVWSPFYEETDPKKRMGLYERIRSENDDDGADALRKKLFDNRHQDKKKTIEEIDRGLWQVLSMQVNIKSTFRFPGSAKKEMNEAMRIFGISEENADREPFRSAVYWEIRNVTKRYLLTCTDPGYGRKLFGLMESSGEEKLERTVKEIYVLARQVPKRYGMRDEMRIFTEALEDEFLSWSEEAREAYEGFLDKQEKGD